MPPMIVHQAKEYYQDLHHNIPLDWTFHHTPSGYVDRDGWLKSMNQFSNICGDYHVNNKILFFDGQNGNFGKHALTQTKTKNIQSFILKVGDSIYYHPNNNGPNSKLKALYNILKAKWMLKYGTLRFQPHHMKYVLVETWKPFTVSYGNIIRDRYTKPHLLPPSTPNMITNTQECVASVQTYSNRINQIVEDTLSPIRLQATSTNEPMVIL